MTVNSGSDATSRFPDTPAARRERPTIALCLGKHWLLPHIAAEARQREWQIVDTHYFDDMLPPDTKLQGALVRALPDSDLVKRLRNIGCAAVRIGRLPHPDDAELPVVLPDRAERGRLAAEHFAERGFRHVGYFGLDPWGDSRELYEGFKSAADRLGMELHLLRGRTDVLSTERNEYRKSLFTGWVRSVPKPLGLLGYADDTAARLCAWTAWAGLRIPIDVAVMGVGNIVDICESTLPRISSVHTNGEGMALAACKLLEKQMAGMPVPTEPMRIKPIAVVARESTDVLATPDRHVAEALRYMWRHLDQDLPVDIIAEEVGIHRRQLERAFKRELGRGINAELCRKRLETFVQLLMATDETVNDLCRRTGFRSRDYLHRIFKRKFDTTPQKFRQQRR